MSLSWTVAQAARECGVSADTIRRRLKAGSLPNAAQGKGGVWSIPISDLIAAGLDPGRPSAPDSVPTQESNLHRQGVGNEDMQVGNVHMHENGQRISSLVKQVENLESSLRNERMQRMHAEQVQDQLRANLDDVRTALRMLEGGRSTPGESQAEPASEDVRPSSDPVEASGSPRSFLSRIFGRSR